MIRSFFFAIYKYDVISIIECNITVFVINSDWFPWTWTNINYLYWHQRKRSKTNCFVVVMYYTNRYSVNTLANQYFDDRFVSENEKIRIVTELGKRRRDDDSRERACVAIFLLARATLLLQLFWLFKTIIKRCENPSDNFNCIFFIKFRLDSILKSNSSIRVR